MADNVEIQGIEFQIKENSDSAVASLEKLQNTLVRLKTATSGGVSALRTTARQLDSLNKALENTSADKIQKIRSLTSGLKSLSEVSAVKISSSVPNQIAALSTALSQIKTTDGDKLIALADGMRPLSELGRSRLTSFISQLGKLPEVMHELDAADLDKFNRQMKELAAAIRPLSDEMQRLGTGFAALPARLQRAITMVNQYNAAVQRGTRRTSMFSRATGMIRFGILYAGLRRVVGLIGTAITESNTYQEVLNLFSVALGKYAKEAQNYAEKVSSVMGIDPAQWMRNQGVFQTLLTGFGDTEDRAYTMSKNLTQLGYDLSSFFNISIEDSMQKLQSGIAGELEPLRRLGYDLSVARLQQEALNLGITKSVSAMNQAEKAELRYYAIMTQVTTAQGDMARTLEAPANQLRVLRAEITQVSRAIGNLFIPILTKVLPYVIAFLQIVRELANALAKLFGFELTDVDWDGVNRGAVAAGELSDNMDAAVDAAKEFKRYTMGFDELNILPSNTGSSGGTDAGVTGSGGLGINLPEYGFLDGAVQSKVSEIKQTIEDNIAEIKATLGAADFVIGAILAFTGINVPAGIAMMASGLALMISGNEDNPDAVKNVLENAIANIDLVSGTAALVIGAILAFSGANIPIGIGLMAFGATELIASQTLTWDKLSEDVRQIIGGLVTFVALGALAVGAILAFSGANIPLGIALMVAGAFVLATAIVPKWNEMPDSVKKTITTVMVILGAAQLVLGALLTFTGVNIPMGIALMVIGAASLATAAALNWDAVSKFLKKSISYIAGIVGGALMVLGVLLLLSGAGIGLGLAVLAAGLASSHAAWKLDDNPITRFVKKMANGIISIVNVVIDAVNEMFHLDFKGLKIGGVQIIPAFNKRLVNIPKIKQFAEGGFPNEGQLFVAREAGAEMVGNIGRRTAVANNDQIVSAVSDGVYRAVMSAMSNKDGVSGDINITINMDGDVVYRNVVKKNKEVVRATGKSPLFA